MDLWNNLPENVVSAPSVNSFDNILDKVWASQELKYDFEAVMFKLQIQNATGNVAPELDLDQF